MRAFVAARGVALVVVDEVVAAAYVGDCTQ